MKVLLAADGHYYRTKDGQVYVDSVFSYSFYKRYLSVFNQVYALVRIEEIDMPPKGSKLASGDNVFFIDLPASTGVKEYLKNYVQTRAIIKKTVDDFDCAIFRVPGVVANLVSRIYSKENKNFAIEVVVDPWEYFSKGTITGFSRPFVRVIWTLGLKRLCKRAKCVSYVTQSYLQKKYPCMALRGKAGYYTSSYSSVELPDEAFKNPRNYEKKNKYLISHVAASFSGYGKGHLVLMTALKMVREKGLDVSVVFVGDGPLRQEFEEFARINSIGDYVHFTGLLGSGREVREVISKSDLFVFPTKAEGLPRVVLEAMAEGLPVVSSPVCGIPEIIEKECLVDFNDVEGYAKVIVELLNDPIRMSKISKENIEKAYSFRSSRLNRIREDFYEKVRDLH